MSTREQILEEREYFVKTLEELSAKQWKADTLCAGWNVEDLAAHLLVRERGNPLARAGILVSFLHHYHDRGIEKTKSIGHTAMIKRLSNPPAWIPGFSTNLIELYVHNEDLLRGGLKRSRKIDDELAMALAGFVPTLARFALRRLPKPMLITVQETLTGDEVEVQRGTTSGDAPHLIIRGQPGELVLLFMGRGRHAQVEVDGDDEALASYRLTDVGV